MRKLKKKRQKKKTMTKNKKYRGRHRYKESKYRRAISEDVRQCLSNVGGYGCVECYKVRDEKLRGKDWIVIL